LDAGPWCYPLSGAVVMLPLSLGLCTDEVLPGWVSDARRAEEIANVLRPDDPLAAVKEAEDAAARLLKRQWDPLRRLAQELERRFSLTYAEAVAVAGLPV